MRSLKLTIEYDGTGLSGWQRQKNGPTVQQHLEEALATLVGEPVAIVGASRTDAGVHARGQSAHFRSPTTIPAHGLRRGMNSKLPAGIAVVALAEVGAEFHARHSARGKHYRYQLLTRADRSPLARLTSWHRPHALDLASMRSAAAAMIGEHDFSAFRASGCGARTTTRRVTEISISEREQLVTIDVRGNAFLRNMVRIMVGTLVAVGEGRSEPGEISDIIASADRTRAGQTAPPQGLTLMSVAYE